MMGSLPTWLLGGAVFAAALGCTRAPQPTALRLEATTLDGRPVDAASMKGTPQVVALWLPG